MKPSRGVRLGFAAVLALALPLAGSTAAQAAEKRELTVMTQNLYLGSSLNPALGATTGEELVAAVAEIYGTMVFTDFPTRAEAPWSPGGGGLVDPADMTTVEEFLTAKLALPEALPTVA